MEWRSVMLKNSMNKLRILAVLAITGVSVAACTNAPSSVDRGVATAGPSATVPTTSTPKASHDGRIYDPKWGLRRP